MTDHLINRKMIMLSLMFVLSCGQINSKEEIKSQKSETVKLNPYRIETIYNSDGSYGYNIMKQNKIVIHQPHVPSLSGNRGFATKEQAAMTAQLVIHKLNNGAFPPTLTKKELDSLGLQLQPGTSVF